jgi:hypothetical protein
VTHSAKEENEVADHAHGEDSEHVPRNEKEGCTTGLAEGVAVDGGLDVGVLVHEAHALLKTPHAALQTGQHKLCDAVARLLRLLLEVGDDGADRFDDR